MDAQKQFNRVERAIKRYNAQLEEAIKKYDTDELYLDKSSTLVSVPEKAVPAQIIKRENGIMDVRLQGVGVLMRVCVDEDGEEYVDGIEEFDEYIKYDKKCLKNGINLWESENPDSFLESEDAEQVSE